MKNSPVGTPQPATRAADLLFCFCGVRSAQRADPAKKPLTASDSLPIAYGINGQFFSNRSTLPLLRPRVDSTFIKAA